MDIVDFYIGFNGHPKYVESKMVEDDIIRVIIQMYEMIIYTNKGECLSDSNFGGDLELLLHETLVSADYVVNILKEQIDTYIPNAVNLGYTLTAQFVKNDREEDVLVTNFKVSGYDIYSMIK